MDELKRKLIEIVGEENVLSAPEDLLVYECDAETLDLAKQELVVLPGSTDEVSRVVALAAANGIAFSPRGAGTGLSGGATTVGGGLSLVLTRMTRVLSVEQFNRVAVAEVGATNLSISQASRRFGLYFAPDPSSQMASTIGGNIAENAGGPHCLKYGMTTQHVLGAKVVLPDGQVVELGGKSRDLLSLDLLGLIVGSEGTLGVVTEAV